MRRNEWKRGKLPLVHRYYLYIAQTWIMINVYFRKKEKLLILRDIRFRDNFVRDIHVISNVFSLFHFKKWIRHRLKPFARTTKLLPHCSITRTPVETISFFPLPTSSRPGSWRFIRNSAPTFYRWDCISRIIKFDRWRIFRGTAISHVQDNRSTVVNRPCNKLSRNVSAARRFKKVLPTRRNRKTP